MKFSKKSIFIAAGITGVFILGCTAAAMIIKRCARRSRSCSPCDAAGQNKKGGTAEDEIPEAEVSCHES